MAGVLGVASGGYGRVVLFDATQPVGEHAHPQVHVLLKVSGTDIHYQIEDKIAQVSDDQMVVLNPWVVHSNMRSKGEKTILLALYIDAVWIGMDGPLLSPGPANLPFSDFQVATTAELRQQVDTLADELATYTSDPQILEDMLTSLVKLIFNLAGAQEIEERRFNGWSSDYRVRKAIREIRKQPSKELKLAELARQVGLSRSQFYTRFKACTGLSPGVYLDTLCCEKAAEDLMGTEDTIAQISERLGFASQGHFTRFFKAKTGVTPQSFRLGAVPD